MKDEEKSAKGTITNNFYGPVGQFINHVENNHIHMGNDGISDKEADSDCCPQVQPVPLMATSEMMQRAVVESVKMGLWWSNRSWAVVYRVWQMKGYMHGFTHFAEEVNKWELELGFKCNYDAVEKPITSGLLCGTPDKWEKNGANKQMVSLANILLEYLDKGSS